MKKNKISLAKNDIVFALVVVFLLGFWAGINFAPQHQQNAINLEDERVVKLSLPAVDNEGNGVVGVLSTSVKPGNGKILLDTSKVLNYIDTQLSGRVAASAAANYAKVSLNNIDVVYTIDVNASLIEGPSAGAAMSVSVLLALENKTAMQNIAITGTINPDGSIGKVGAVFEKAVD